MKKIILLLIFIFPVTISAYQVKLYTCVDGDTFRIKLDNKKYYVRLLAVDTYELDSKNSFQRKYAYKASKYTCKLLKNSKNIYIKNDPNSAEEDKYGRLLGWVYVDDTLLQELLVKNGYAKVAYIFDNYLYTNELLKYQELAKKNKVGIWKK